MSDPYSPYQTPSAYPPGTPGNYSQPPYPGQPLTTGVMPGIVRAAAIMLGILGGLILVGSVLLAVMMLNFPVDQLRESGAFEAMPPDMDIETALRYGAGAVGICGGLFGLIYLLLTPFVWKGNRGGIIAAIVFASLQLLLVVVIMLGAMAQGGAQAIPAAIVYLVPGAFLAVLLFLLIRSLRAIAYRAHESNASASLAAWQGYYGQQAPPPPLAPQQGWGDGPTQPPAPRQE